MKTNIRPNEKRKFNTFDAEAFLILAAVAILPRRALQGHHVHSKSGVKISVVCKTGK